MGYQHLDREIEDLVATHATHRHVAPSIPAPLPPGRRGAHGAVLAESPTWALHTAAYPHASHVAPGDSRRFGEDATHRWNCPAAELAWHFSTRPDCLCAPPRSSAAVPAPQPTTKDMNDKKGHWSWLHGRLAESAPNGRLRRLDSNSRSPGPCSSSSCDSWVSWFLALIGAAACSPARRPMSTWRLRFVHAADLHLELPPGGVDYVPHLRSLLRRAAYSAAQPRV